MRKLKLDELNRKSVKDYKSSEKLPIVVVLDNIRSAQNVGSIFRTADCLGLDSIYLCGVSPRPPHKEITKTAIGATHSVNWEYYEEISHAIDSLKVAGYKIVGIEQTSESQKLSSYQIKEPIAIVMGNEVEGVSNHILDQLDDCVEIEQFGTKHSFNVAVCAGIVCYALSKKLRP